MPSPPKALAERVAATVTLLAVGVLATLLARASWNSVVAYTPPFRFADGETTGGAPLAERVVLVLVDGLRLDASREMPFLNGLREAGGDFDCTAAAPSYSRPGRAALGTGAWSEVHGATTNFHDKALAVDNLFRSAARGGRSVAVAGSLWGSLFRPDLERLKVRVREPPVADEPGRYFEIEPRLREYGEESAAFVMADRSSLAILDLLVTDYAAHEFGGRSEEYRRAAARIDRILETLVKGLDLARTAVIVTSDHGHLDEGGHGGPEPEVLATPLVLVGRGVKRGAHGAARQIDVAPTIAALLGIALPGAAQGRVLIEALEVSDEQRADLVQREERQRAAFASDYLAGIGAPAFAGSPQPAAVEAQVKAARLARIASDRRMRLPMLLVVLLVSLPAVWRLLRRKPSLTAVATAVVGYGLGFRFLVYGRGIRLALSAINHEEDVNPYFLRIALLALVTLVLCLAGAFVVTRRSGAVSPGPYYDVGLAAIAIVAYLLIAVVALGHWRHGLFMEWQRPDMGEGFSAFVALIQIQAVTAGALLVPGIAWLVLRATRKAALAAMLVAAFAWPASAQTAGSVYEDVPAKPDPGRHYLLYIHGRIVELQGRHARSPRHGPYEYDAILRALADAGLEVIAELRGPKTGMEYAGHVAAQVRMLLAAGVPPSNVTVAGFSKGGALALVAAGRLSEPKLNYVIMAGCATGGEAEVEALVPKMMGRMLSLYDAADDPAVACGKLFARAPGVNGRETRLSVGKGHGTFYVPRAEWLGPLAEWAGGATPRR